MNQFSKKVYQLTKKIPKGRIATYKLIAQALSSKAYQAVGQALKTNPHPPQVPCHRVVKTNGNLGGFKGSLKAKNTLIKKQLLEKEGIKFKQNKILNFDKLLFKF